MKRLVLALALTSTPALAQQPATGNQVCGNIAGSLTTQLSDAVDQLRQREAEIASLKKQLAEKPKGEKPDAK